jgi:hypothetical protein
LVGVYFDHAKAHALRLAFDHADVLDARNRHSTGGTLGLRLGQGMGMRFSFVGSKETRESAAQWRE